MLIAKRVRRAWLPLAFVASAAFACEAGTVLVAENGPSEPGGAGGAGGGGGAVLAGAVLVGRGAKSRASSP